MITIAMNRFVSTILAGFAATIAFAQAPAASPAVQSITRAGLQKPGAGPAEYFTGPVTVTPLFPARQGFPSAANVTFSAGARSAWHTHPAGQQLIVTAGRGLTQQWDGPVEEIRTGDVVWCPPGVKHWHGAAPDAPMTHVAVTAAVDGRNVEWMEKVTDAQYHAPRPAPARSAPGPSAAQKLFGDVAPKLADLTDNVLFGDVWARPGLSQRDRSLVTVSALIALNRPDQLNHHFARALQNGLSEEALVETLTHLAFYAGWPNAINAAAVARQVFQKPVADAD
jgi:4-carboxymuconolactone decarboxylase